MTNEENEEKANEICCKYCTLRSFCKKKRQCEMYKSVLKMAAWKDQQFAEERKELIAKRKELITKANHAVNDSHESGAQFMRERLIEKAAEWLEPIFKDLSGYSCGGDLVEDFKKAMKEE
jgi:hypothetical protein